MNSVSWLAPNQVVAVRGLLEVMLDPVARAIANAPADDEAVTEEDRRRVREGQAPVREARRQRHSDGRDSRRVRVQAGRRFPQ